MQATLASRCAALGLLLACASAAAQEIPSIEIFGQGQTRQVQNLTRNDLASALPGTSPLKTLEKLPGVSFQSADVFGAYEWSTRLSVRGFSQGQLGFTLDDIPLGNMSYGNNNGLHISRAITPENIRQVDLSQGAGAVGTASSGNLGGTVQFFSSDPLAEAAGTFSQTLGSDHTVRRFARLDSGSFANGASLYASALRQRAEKWKGIGPQDLDQFNSKFLQRFGAHQFSAFFNYANRSENDYQDMSIDMRQRLGWNWDNYAPDWDRALQAARGIFTGGVNNLDDAYFTARGLRKDYLGGATLKLDGGDAPWQFRSTVYRHVNDGQGHWYTPYTASSPAIPVSIRTTEYGVRRHGIVSDLSWTMGRHTLDGGFWFERNAHELTRNYYAVTGPEDSNRFLDNPFLTAFRQQFRVRTRQLYLQDTVQLMDERLKLNAGFKRPSVTIDTTSMNELRAAGTLKARASFLPQVGASYDLDGGDEIFASYSRNLRAFEAGVYGQFSQSQAAFDANGASLKPERSSSADLGLRWRRGALAGSVAIYVADFRDRLLSVANCAGVVGCPNTVVNVGRVATRGLESAAHWSVAPHWSWFNALTVNDSTYRSDYLDNGLVVPVSGKRVVDAPRLLLHTELAYDDKRWFGKLSGKYTGKRFYSFVNDASVPAFVTWDLSGGVHLGELTIALHAGNLLNRRYFGTIGSNQFVASDPQGTFATLLTGAPREFFLTVNGKFH
jgi:iron complex outermembrane receptor protein